MPYEWQFKDYPKPNGHSVFGTFVGGGGSTMGYKLAGFNHLGGVEIDVKMGSIYQANHNPEHFFLQDIRVFNTRDDLPPELYSLDILDGSPPCSSFSMAGNREKDWGKKKQFREGQAKQRLDDLVFEYIKTIKKLKPKVAILENVTGLVKGNAKIYAKEIGKQFSALGYSVQVFNLNGATMGLPQKRQRIFFIGLRNDIKKPKLKLSFNFKPVPFGEVVREQSKGLRKVRPAIYEMLIQAKPHHKSLSDINVHGHYFTYAILDEKRVCPTIIAGGEYYVRKEMRFISKDELCKIGSFPKDFNFRNMCPVYVVGMSVPPLMTMRIAEEITKQWLN